MRKRTKHPWGIHFVLVAREYLPLTASGGEARHTIGRSAADYNQAFRFALTHESYTRLDIFMKYHRTVVASPSAGSDTAFRVEHRYFMNDGREFFTVFRCYADGEHATETYVLVPLPSGEIVRRLAKVKRCAGCNQNKLMGSMNTVCYACRAERTQTAETPAVAKEAPRRKRTLRDTCEYCGEKMVAKRSTKRFCSPRCRKASRRTKGLEIPQ